MYIEKFQLFCKSVKSVKHLCLIVLEILNKDILKSLSLLFIRGCYIFYNFFIILLKKLNSFILENFTFANIIRRWMFEQYDILLKYSRRNAVIEYTLGKQDSSRTVYFSKFRITTFTLMYIFDKFINTLEQAVERFFVKIRRIFIKLVFKLPDSIYYIFFEAQFDRVKIQKKVALAHLYLLYVYVFSVIVYLIDLALFYAYVSLQNLFRTIYEKRKILCIYLFLFVIFNFLFKQSASIIYEFFLSFFDFRNIYYSQSYKSFFNNQITDISNKKLKYNIFFSYEYKKYYASGHLYKVYYIFLTIKYELFKNLENYWKLFYYFSPLSFFKYHGYFNLIFYYKSRRKNQNSNKRYSWTKKNVRRSKAKENDSYDKKEFWNFVDVWYHRRRMRSKIFKVKYTDFGEKAPFDLQEFIWFAWLVDFYKFIKFDVKPVVIEEWNRKSFKNRKWYRRNVLVLFVYKVLNKIFWVIKKIVRFILTFFKK